MNADQKKKDTPQGKRKLVCVRSRIAMQLWMKARIGLERDGRCEILGGCGQVQLDQSTSLRQYEQSAHQTSLSSLGGARPSLPVTSSNCGTTTLIFYPSVARNKQKQ
jgi:hypothetical protein